jgi:hypothetical protein
LLRLPLPLCTSPPIRSLSRLQAERVSALSPHWDPEPPARSGLVRGQRGQFRFRVRIGGFSALAEPLPPSAIEVAPGVSGSVRQPARSSAGSRSSVMGCASTATRPGPPRSPSPPRCSTECSTARTPSASHDQPKGLGPPLLLPTPCNTLACTLNRWTVPSNLLPQGNILIDLIQFSIRSGHCAAGRPTAKRKEKPCPPWRKMCISAGTPARRKAW